ncbi:MAG: dephospho-CoA kinase [Spirochaetota bacterium]
MRIGVTGMFASGKGTVCSIFEEMGAIVIDTDIISREIMLPGSAGLNAVIKAFGSSFLDNSGALDRRRFGRFVFEDGKRVETLNKITHPLILEQTLALSSDPAGIFIINAPVLFESGFDKYMDRIIVVSAPHESSVKRGISRDKITAEEIEQRLKNQISLNEKIKNADYTVDNSGSLENTRKQVVTIWNSLKISSLTMPM